MKNLFGLALFPIAMAILIIGFIVLQLTVFYNMVLKKDERKEEYRN